MPQKYKYYLMAKPDITIKTHSNIEHIKDRIHFCKRTELFATYYIKTSIYSAIDEYLNLCLIKTIEDDTECLIVLLVRCISNDDEDDVTISKICNLILTYYDNVEFREYMSELFDLLNL